MMHKTYKNHTLLLVTYLIFYNNPKGKIFFLEKSERYRYKRKKILTRTGCEKALCALAVEKINELHKLINSPHL